MSTTLIAPVTPMARPATARRDRPGVWLWTLLLVLLPYQRLRIPFSLAPVDGVLVAVMGYALLKAWRYHQRLDFPLIGAMWTILCASAIATLAGLGHFESVVAILQELYLFAWFLLLTNHLMTLAPSTIDGLLKLWSGVACLIALTTILGMFRIGPTMFYVKPTQAPDTTSAIARAVGTFNNANAAAVYLSVSFFVVLATSWPLVVRIGLAGWLFLGMLGTGSNGAMLSTLLACAVLLGVYLLVRQPEAMLGWSALFGILVGLALLGILALAAFPASFPDGGVQSANRYLTHTLGRFSTSLARRFGLISWAWDIYTRHPLGTGPNSYSTILASLHNDYAAFLFERGPLGLLGWLWMIAAILYAAFNTAHHLEQRASQWAVLALGAGFLACAINALSHEISHMRQVWLLLAFLFAFRGLVSTSTEPPQSQQGDTP